jgi:hypothetical protein
MTTTALDPRDRTAAPASALLARVRAERAAADAAEARLLELAVDWALMHPAGAGDAAADWEPGMEIGLPIAGEGAPLVAEFCVAEFAAALGLSTEAGRNVLGNALELSHRLRRLWARVRAGDLQAWRARRIAEQTVTLSPDAADYVDRHLAAVAHRVGPAQTQRLVEEAMLRLMPVEAEAAMERAWDSRHVTVHDDHLFGDGTMLVEAKLDIADAIDLDAALADRAAALTELGCAATLDVRRSLALGDLARTQLAFGFDQTPAAGSSATATRQVVLHVHLTDAAVTGTDPGTAGVHLARLERGDRILLADQVRAWCGRPETQVTVKPVVDLHDRLSTGAYEIPDRIRDHVIARDPTCVFPWCSRNARRCDLDHITPYDPGGPTATHNLAPLCRRHHRLKTHAGWTYAMTEPGTYAWRSPHGLAYLRDHRGTTAVRPPDR